MYLSFPLQMVRSYKRSSDRGSYGQERLQQALQDVRRGIALKSASRLYGIPPKTLRRHRDGKVQNPGKVFLGPKSPVLPEPFETELVTYIKYMEASLYGLTVNDVRHIAFELANKSGLSHPFNMDNQSAGKDWLRGFLNRHQDLSIRSPTGTSLNRIRGFTRESVAGFFDVLRGILERNAFTPLNIWNMDETGVSSVVSPSNVIATKGVRQVRKITSGERGKNVTVVCCMNAAGTYVPPLFIFPRKRMADGLITGAPIGSLGCVTPSGWIDSETFIKWLKHFASFTK